MLLFKNNKIISLDTSEDSNVNIKAIRSNYNDSYIKDEIRKVIIHSEHGTVHYGMYNLKLIQSPYSDGSGHTYFNTYKTVGALIYDAIKSGFKVFNGDVEITIDVVNTKIVEMTSRDDLQTEKEQSYIEN